MKLMQKYKKAIKILNKALLFTTRIDINLIKVVTKNRF